jgi:localization factor PodJL
MSAAAAPWSVKGIDPKAREIAKDLARRQGLTLGDWLNRMIEDSAAPGEAMDPEPPPPIAADELERLSDVLGRLEGKVEAAERRSTLAISGIDQTVIGLLSRLETAEREHVQVAARFEGVLQEIKDQQNDADERLARTEEAAAQPRSIEALRALETALGKVAAHLYDSETRTRESLGQMRSELTGLTDHVGRLAETDAPPPQAMIDGVVTRIVQRLEEAEERTSSAVRGLEAAVGDMEQRLQVAEARSELPELKLEQLAQELSRNFETAREDLSDKIEQAATSRLESMERSLREVSGQVAAAEQRSTRAIDRMGHEVLRVAETLGRRMEGVESRSAQAMEQVGGDVARIADVMEGRLRRTDQAQAESLERLGSEIARITERLAERVAAAERRSAQAIDDVGEQVSRVTDRLNQRSERASADLAERIRQSEERTARLLEEAREKIDQRVASTEKRLSDQVAAAPPPVAPAPAASEFGAIFAASDLPPGPFGEDTGPTLFARRGSAPAGFVPPVESLPPEPVHSPFESDDFDAATMFRSFEAEASEPEAAAPEPVQALEADLQEDADEDYLPEAAPNPDTFETPAKLSTRELIEQARAAARAAAQGEAKGPKRSLFSGISAKSPKKKGKLRVGVMVAASAAALGVTAAGLTLYSAQSVDHPRAHDGADEGLPIVPAAAPAISTPQAAVALVPHLTQPATSPLIGAGGVDQVGLYTDAVRRIESHDTGGVADLRKDANLGYAPAQFYLAKLYETGDAGLPKDVAAARLWTQRAADNGERKAMHNLGLYFFEGTGGPKNLVAAAQWFRKAADLGLVDSQYNLARLYEGGFGVPQSASEAYKWYLVAARSGDAESRAAAERLKPQIPAAQARADEAFAANFRPGAPATTLQTASR